MIRAVMCDALDYGWFWSFLFGLPQIQERGGCYITATSALTFSRVPAQDLRQSFYTFAKLSSLDSSLRGPPSLGHQFLDTSLQSALN